MLGTDDLIRKHNLQFQQERLAIDSQINKLTGAITGKTCNIVSLVNNRKLGKGAYTFRQYF